MLQSSTGFNIFKSNYILVREGVKIGDMSLIRGGGVAKLL